MGGAGRALPGERRTGAASDDRRRRSTGLGTCPLFRSTRRGTSIWIRASWIRHPFPRSASGTCIKPHICYAATTAAAHSPRELTARSGASKPSRKSDGTRPAMRRSTMTWGPTSSARGHPLPTRALLPGHLQAQNGQLAETYFRRLTDGRPSPDIDAGDCGSGVDGQPRPWDCSKPGLTPLERKLLAADTARRIRGTKPAPRRYPQRLAAVGGRGAGTGRLTGDASLRSQSGAGSRWANGRGRLQLCTALPAGGCRSSHRLADHA